MKRVLSVIMTVLMLAASVAVSVSAAEYSTRLPFTDTKAGAWYAEYVKYMI